MTYEQFIEEIRRLVAEGTRLIQDGATLGTPKFRQWRHEAQSIVSTATRLGLDLPGDFRSDQRGYRAVFYEATPKHHRDVFVRDMGDSLTELRFLVEQFDKFGAAQSTEKRAGTHPKVALAAPDKVTFRWLFDNVSLAGWAIIAGLMITLLSVGYAAGRYDTVRRLIADVASLFSSSPPPH